jgi:hypothetical protein
MYASLGLDLTYIEPHLKVSKRPVGKVTRDLDSALGSLLSGKQPFRDAGETVMAIISGDWCGTKGHLTEGVCQTTRRRWLSNRAMRRAGLGSMSDLGNHKVWDRICMEGAYTAMSSFNLDFLHASSRDTTTGSQDAFMRGIWGLKLTWSEARGIRRQSRARSSWRRNSERVMLT